METSIRGRRARPFNYMERGFVVLLTSHIPKSAPQFHILIGLTDNIGPSHSTLKFVGLPCGLFVKMGSSLNGYNILLRNLKLQISSRILTPPL